MSGGGKLGTVRLRRRRAEARGALMHELLPASSTPTPRRQSATSPTSSRHTRFGPEARLHGTTGLVLPSQGSCRVEACGRGAVVKEALLSSTHQPRTPAADAGARRTPIKHLLLHKSCRLEDAHPQVLSLWLAAHRKRNLPTALSPYTPPSISRIRKRSTAIYWQQHANEYTNI
jgi:hypothetical protein